MFTCIDTHMYKFVLEYNVCTKESKKKVSSRAPHDDMRKKSVKDNYKIMSTSFILS